MTRITSEPLSAFLSALRLTVQVKETAGWLDIYQRMVGDSVRSLRFAAVESLTTAYGDALVKACIKREDYPEIELNRGLTREEFERQRDGLDPRDDYILDLRVDKRRLVETALGADHASATTFWFFATSVENILSKGLDEFGKAIWGTQPDQGRTLLVGDTDLKRIGPMLAIFGGVHLPDRPPSPPTPDSNVIDPSRAYGKVSSTSAGNTRSPES